MEQQTLPVRTFLMGIRVLSFDLHIFSFQVIKYDFIIYTDVLRLDRHVVASNSN